MTKRKAADTEALDLPEEAQDTDVSADPVAELQEEAVEAPAEESAEPEADPVEAGPVEEIPEASPRVHVVIDAAPEKAESPSKSVTYHGNADALSYGPYKFRPGLPVRVPSNIAAELLTHKSEKFEVKE